MGLTSDKQAVRTVTQLATGFGATLSGSALGVNWDPQDNQILRAAARLQGNVVTQGTNGSNFGTHVSGHLRGGLGRDVETSEMGPGMFFGAGGSFNLGTGLNQVIGGNTTAFVGPETGFRFYSKNLVVLATPSVGWGLTALVSQIQDLPDLHAEGWAMGGRVVLDTPAVQVYGDYFNIARSNQRPYDLGGAGGNAEVRVKLSDRMSLLGVWEFTRVANQLGYIVRTNDDREVIVPQPIAAELSRINLGVSLRIR